MRVGERVGKDEIFLLGQIFQLNDAGRCFMLLKPEDTLFVGMFEQDPQLQRYDRDISIHE